jgi:predicted O-methyltransferase YrrM
VTLRSIIKILNTPRMTRYNHAVSLVKSFEPPSQWNGDLFQMPEPVIEALVRLIERKHLFRVLELGTGFGATACIIASVFQQLSKGRIVTIDNSLHDPVNISVLAKHCGISDLYLDSIIDRSGYIWVLGEMLAAAKAPASSSTLFDMCILDGAHEWDPDAGAFLLADRLLRPGGYMILDDLHFRLSDISNAVHLFPNRSSTQLNTQQVRMIWDLLIKSNKRYGRFVELYNGRVGVAKKLM